MDKIKQQNKYPNALRAIPATVPGMKGANSLLNHAEQVGQNWDSWLQTCVGTKFKQHITATEITRDSWDKIGTSEHHTKSKKIDVAG